MAQKFSVNKYGSLFTSFRESIQSNTGITNWNSDSVIKSLVDPLASELSRINSNITTVLDSIDLKTAKGESLDVIGQKFGCPRLRANRGGCESTDNNFGFYIKNGTFGSVNNNQDIVVPKGTTISVGRNVTSSKVYLLPRDIVLKAGDTRYFVELTSSSIGSASNVAANTLNTHNFSNYSAYSSGLLLCTNRMPITNGRNQESDADYRVRIFNQYSSYSRISLEALNLKQLSIPGITRQRLVKNYFGFGTSALFVFGGNREVPQASVDFLQSKINTSMGFCADVIVVPGIRVYLDLDITVWVEKDLTLESKDQLNQEIRRVISNGLVMNQGSSNINLQPMVSSLPSQIPKIASVTRASDRSKFIDAAYVRKNYGGGSTVASERLKLTSSSYSLKENEFFSVGLINVKIERV